MARETMTLEVGSEAHEIMKRASEKSGVKIRTLTELLITTNINFLNSPVRIANKLNMVKEEGE